MEFNMEIMDETLAMDAIDDLMTGIAFGKLLAKHSKNLVRYYYS